jgi:hypothetical protein
LRLAIENAESDRHCGVFRPAQVRYVRDAAVWKMNAEHSAPTPIRFDANKSRSGMATVEA